MRLVGVLEHGVCGLERADTQDEARVERSQRSALGCPVELGLVGQEPACALAGEVLAVAGPVDVDADGIVPSGSPPPTRSTSR